MHPRLRAVPTLSRTHLALGRTDLPLVPHTGGPHLGSLPRLRHAAPPPGASGRRDIDLPGLRGHHRDFACAQCGVEGYLLKGRLCARCTLADKLTALFDDGTGRVRTELVPLMKGVLLTDRPTSTLTWFANPQVHALLTGLARGAIPITHEALGQLPNWRTASFMRELLMQGCR